MDEVTVGFSPGDISIAVPVGTSLLEAAGRAGIMIRSSCGGDGTCGRCAVRVRSGEVRDVPARGQPDLVLACRSLAMGDCEIEIPEASLVTGAQILTDRGTVLTEQDRGGLDRYQLDPLIKQRVVTVDPPTLTENASDLARVTAMLRRDTDYDEVTFDVAAIRQLPGALREGEWTVTVTLVDRKQRATVIDVRPGADRRPVYGLCVDVGTTTVVTLLVDMETGITVDSRGEYNRQARYGDDVITRIIHASDRETGLSDLQWAVVDTINHLVAEAVLAAGIRSEDVRVAVVAGNTTMMHLLTSVSPTHLRLEPYIPAAVRFPELTATELGIQIHERAPVYLIPSVASYVGGDIVAGALMTGVGSREEIEVLIDIGTNGEILLGNRDWLVSCACSAGPCFEGSGIKCGMRAEPGAVQRIAIGDGLEILAETVGGATARGLCGSGLVDAIARLAEAGVIDRAGRLTDRAGDRVRTADEGREFVLLPGSDSRDIVIGEGDVQNVLRAKAAVYAGIRCLLSALELEIDAIERLYVSGGFGSYLVLEDAVMIGLLPDLSADRYRFAGNTSVKGARLALLSRKAWEDANDLASRMTYIELSVGVGFMEEFTSAMFLPHTDLSQFPSVSLNGADSGTETEERS